MNGIKNNNKIKKIIMNIINCLGICCINYGLKGGSIEECYNIVYVDIQK